MRTTCRVVLSTLLLIAPLSLGQVSEKLTVTLVEVPVTVVDSSGNPVRGLKAENFQLSDDRGRHEITSFEAIDFAVPEAQIGAVARRNFLLLFDLSNATPNKLGRAQKAARAFVQGQTHRLDHLAVGTIDSEHGYRMVTAFTTDRELILSAIGDPALFVASDPLGVGRSAMISRDPGMKTTPLQTVVGGTPFW
jgi:VWFA-related protein